MNKKVIKKKKSLIFHGSPKSDITAKTPVGTFF